MTRAERIAELQLLVLQMQGEERIAKWMKAHPRCAICATVQTSGRHYVEVIDADQNLIARGWGADEADARGQAFSTIFTNETAEKNEATR